jgi:dihydroflavonol-4-reductase
MRVLVTGGTGFVAGWCIAQLLAEGHAVRTTVRGDRAPEAGVEVVRADLLADDGWETAMAGVERVLHVASPMTGADMLTPAREGTVRVLRAAQAAGVPHVVMTSSCAAATPPVGSLGEFDESVWTDPGQPDIDAYRHSKLVAEQAAWAAVEGGPTTLTTVLPGAVFGPLRSSEGLGSVAVIARMLRGMPGVPRVPLNIVDVRDVADLHVRAMTAPEAVGERFIAVSGMLWMAEVGEELHARLGERAARAPRVEIPDADIQAAAQVNPELAGIVPMLGRRYTHTSAKAQKLLGWAPRDPRETVTDCAESLLARGVG